MIMKGDPQQKAKYFLKQWQYLTRNVQQLEAEEKKKASIFFKALKKMKPDDVQLLADRYLRSTEKTNFRYAVGDHMSVKPVSFKVMANTLDMDPKDVQTQMRIIERELGSFIIELSNQAAESQINLEESSLLDMFEDPEERSIMERALQEIEAHRTIKANLLQ